MTMETLAPAAGERGRLHEHLLEMLHSVNDWLKFAESKNTTGLTLSSAALAVLAQFTTGLGLDLSGWVAVGMAASFLLLVSSIGVAALSFLPQTRVEGRRVVRTPSDDDNLLFYGHLADYDHRELMQAIGARYLVSATPDRFAEDISRQIVANAAITVRKLRLFRLTVVLFAVGVVVGMVAVGLGNRP